MFPKAVPFACCSISVILFSLSVVLKPAGKNSNINILLYSLVLEDDKPTGFCQRFCYLKNQTFADKQNAFSASQSCAGL